MPSQCLNANISNIYTFQCPSHEWEAIQNYIHTTFASLDTKYLAVTKRVDSPDWVAVTGQSSQRRLLFTDDRVIFEGYDSEQAIATTQQLAVADALTETGNL